MKNNKDKLITLFERKIELLLEKNEGYARFKGINPFKLIKEILSKKPSKADIMDLGFLLHLNALQLTLTMYKNLSPFLMFNFKKDLQDITNMLHAYQRHSNPQENPFFELNEVNKFQKLIPLYIDLRKQKRCSTDNPELYNVILDMLEEAVDKTDVEIPSDIIKEMQCIDLKKIYNELPTFIEKKKHSTVKNLSADFSVFENDRLSLVAVFNEVLYLANEGKLSLSQKSGDVGVHVLK